MKLGILYEPGSVDVVALAVATAEDWPLVWLIDAETPIAEADLLGRFGEVVDIEGLAPSVIAERCTQIGVGGITAFADSRLLSLSAIGAAMGVPHNSPATALRLVDKLAERAAEAASGVPVPGHRGLDADTDPADVAAAIADLSFPVVLKPAAGVGGRNTFAAEDPADALACFAELSRTSVERIVIEECLGAYPPGTTDGVGDYVSAELLAARGAYQVLAITGRMPLAPPFRETGAFLPASLAPETAAAVTATALHAARALGVEVGCLHVEIKLTSDGPRVIEVNGRGGGGGIPQMLRTLGASDPYRLAAAVAMGEAPTVVPIPADGPIAYAFAVQPPLDLPARLVSDWPQRLEQVPGVDTVRTQTNKDTASIADGSYGYLMFVNGTVPDRDSLLSAYAQLNALVEVVS